jgi:imidazolonepropionase-like amidohydrolase
MKQLIIATTLVLTGHFAIGQDNVLPTAKQTGSYYISGGTVHVGNGTVIENGYVLVKDGKIAAVATGNIPDAEKNVPVMDAKGKQVYPGLILASSTLGLVEVPSVRSTVDATEMGEFNANIRSIVAYNADSKVINTLRSNGVVLANVVPQGQVISGSSSVVQLDAWNWEDAAYKMDGNMHLFMPNLLVRPDPFAEFRQTPPTPPAEQLKRSLEKIEEIKKFFREAKAYMAQANRSNTNLKFEAVKGLFAKTQQLMVHCDVVREMLTAIDFKKEFGFNIVIVGGSESFQITDLLKQNNIPVVLGQMFSLPTTTEDAVDLPYRLPAILQKAGVLFAINDEDGQNRGRNLPFNAGTAAAYGLSKEEALTAITLNAAKILGIDDKAGSLEVGKDANIVISNGDILDMRTSVVTDVFIQGKKVSMDDKHKQLKEKYMKKYGL